jgi:hypothetical protein
LRDRKDRWTPTHQTDLLGRPAEARSAAAAARHVGLTRQSTYRLRDKAGGESFAAPWDAILADLRAARKSTHGVLRHRLLPGTSKPVLRGGKHVATPASPDEYVVLRLYRQEMHRRRSLRRLVRRSR